MPRHYICATPQSAVLTCLVKYQILGHPKTEPSCPVKKLSSSQTLFCVTYKKIGSHCSKENQRKLSKLCHSAWKLSLKLSTPSRKLPQTGSHTGNYLEPITSNRKSYRKWRHVTFTCACCILYHLVLQIVPHQITLFTRLSNKPEVSPSGSDVTHVTDLPKLYHLV